MCKYSFVCVLFIINWLNTNSYSQEVDTTSTSIRFLQAEMHYKDQHGKIDFKYPVAIPKKTVYGDNDSLAIKINLVIAHKFVNQNVSEFSNLFPPFHIYSSNPEDRGMYSNIFSTYSIQTNTSNYVNINFWVHIKTALIQKKRDTTTLLWNKEFSYGSYVIILFHPFKCLTLQDILTSKSQKRLLNYLGLDSFGRIKNFYYDSKKKRFVFYYIKSRLDQGNKYLEIEKFLPLIQPNCRFKKWQVQVSNATLP